jgi:hypothetical protein
VPGYNNSIEAFLNQNRKPPPGHSHGQGPGENQDKRQKKKDADLFTNNNPAADPFFFWEFNQRH